MPASKGFLHCLKIRFLAGVHWLVERPWLSPPYLFETVFGWCMGYYAFILERAWFILAGLVFLFVLLGWWLA